MIRDGSSDIPLTAQTGPAIPMWFRAIGVAIAAALILPCVIYLARYTYEPERFVPPTELGLGVVIVAGVILMLVSIAPWHAMGQIFSKLGPIEFAQIINAQNQEHVEDFSELRIRVDDLEEKARGITGLGSIAEHVSSLSLHPLLSKFLRQFSPTAFSPVRIQQWGARQPGFEELSKYKSADIKVVLQKMVADGSASTTVSRLGNTLYRSAE